MSKVAAYLQEHILGEVSTHPAMLEAMSTDASVLKMTPEMIVYPRVTNDIRKVARFAWQLAEKGHQLPITARGLGTDQTGGAIGKGIVLSLPAHMDAIFEFDIKQKLVRVQPGVTSSALNSALALQGAAVPSLPSYGTVGGAVAKNAASPLSGRHGSTAGWVRQLEVVLANGDVLQTGRISKRELGRKKGQQNFEGEIYRTLDNLIEDNWKMIEQKLAGDIRDNAGYYTIADVKRKDGSFDLTPLFAASQGTLGIISEMIMRAELVSMHRAVAVISFASFEAARDALDQLQALNPALLDYFDGKLFERAAAQGKAYEIYKPADAVVAAVVVVAFDDFSERARVKNLKKVAKTFGQTDAVILTSEDHDVDELLAVREVTAFTVNPSEKGASAPPLFDGVYIPQSRFEEFSIAVAALGEKYQVALPLHGRMLESVYFTRPQLQLHKVGDKQKVFKLLDEYSSLVDYHGGHLIGDGGEGRVKARFAYKMLDDDVLELFAAVKATFDPHAILNPGVKQTGDLKQLATHLRADYDTAVFANTVLYN